MRVTSAAHHEALAAPADGAQSPSVRVSRTGVWPARWRTFLQIAGFWTLFALVTLLNLYLSGVNQRASTPWGLVGFSFIGAYTWAALTPILFGLAKRFDLENEQWPAQVFILGLVALAVSVMVSLVVAVLSAPIIEDGITGASSWRQEVEILSRYRFLYDLLASMVILAAGLALTYFRRYQARQEETIRLRTQLVESRLEALRRQLDPHFLFNTLNAVAALVKKDPAGVRRMISRLSELLRYSLDGTTESEVPLKQEIKVLELYFDIMRTRYEGRLRTSISAEPDVVDALVPNLILQPLAENAIKHGISKAAGRGTIEFEAFREADMLVLVIRDSGGKETASGDDSPPPSDRQGGVGLRQARERLEQLYADAWSLELSPAPGRGTVVELRLPYHLQPVAVLVAV